MSLSRRYPASRLEDDDTFWGRLSPTTRHCAALGILLVIAVSFFAPAVFEGKALHGTDVVSWRANAEAILDYEERTGERVLWAPNVFSGMPSFLMRYQEVVPQADTVINALRPYAWPASHLFVLFVGVYLLVYYLTRNHFSGVLSAVAFGLTTYIPIILSVGHNTKFAALAYAPFVLLAFVYTLRNPSLLGGLFFAGALALDLRAKHPQITYYVLMLALVWWIVELIAAWQDEELVPFAKSTGWLALGTGGALLMVAHPYLAIYEYKQFSVRGAEAVAAGNGDGGASAWQKAMQWSQGPKELFTLVVAEAFGGGGRTYWGPKTFTEGPHYIGGVVAALSGLTVWKVRSRATWGLGAGVIVTMLFALGKHAPWINGPMFNYFPFFESFRAPETWLSISALGLAVLGGIGLDYCLERSEDRTTEQEKTQSILYVFGGVLAVMLLLRVGPNLFFDFEKKNERQRMVQAIQQQRPDLSIQSPQVQQFIRKQMQNRKDERRAAFTSDATRTLLAVGAALVLLWLYRRRRLTAAWLVGGLVVTIVLIDLWGVDRRYLSTDQFSTQPDAEAKIPTTAVDQYIRKQVDASGGPGRFRVLPLRTPYSRNPTGGRAAYASYHYQSIGGYHAAKLQRYQDYIDHIAQLTGRSVPNENALDLMNTRYIVAQQQLPGTRIVYRDQQSGTLVLENPDAVARGFFVGETEVVADPRQTWQRLRSSSFDPRRTAVLPEPLEAPVTPIDSGSTAEATLESYTPMEIEWSLQTDAPRLFVASEVYYPAGWNAYLDGEPVPIHRANYLLRGVHVPEGEHTLVMRFEPKADRYGIWVAGTTTAAVYGSIVGILGWGYRRRWRQFFSEEVDDDASA
jgi:hypothetical protein